MIFNVWRCAFNGNDFYAFMLKYYYRVINYFCWILNVKFFNSYPNSLDFIWDLDHRVVHWISNSDLY